MLDEEMLDMIKDGEVKPKNLWLKVYNDETGEEGLVSVNEMLDAITSIFEEEFSAKSNNGGKNETKM